MSIEWSEEKYKLEFLKILKDMKSTMEGIECTLEEIQTMFQEASVEWPYYKGESGYRAFVTIDHQEAKD